VIAIDVLGSGRIVSCELRKEDELIVIFQNTSFFTHFTNEVYSNYIGIEIYKNIEGAWLKVKSNEFNDFTLRHNFGVSFDLSKDYLVIGSPYGDLDVTKPDGVEGVVYVYKFE